MKIKQLISGLLLALASASVFAVPVVLDITFDDFPAETGFGIFTAGSDTSDLLTGIPYDPSQSSTVGFDDGYVLPGDLDNTTNGGNTYQFVWDLAPGDYEFVIVDSFGDGICCDWGNGGYELSVDGESVIAGGMFGDQDGGDFTVAAAAVAEPSTLVLLGLGLIGFAAARRRS